MDVVLITYDLRDSSDRRRRRLRDAIQNEFFRTYEHVEFSVYLVGSESRPSLIRDQLQPFLEDGDRLFVGRIESSAWYGDARLRQWVEETRSMP